LENTERRGLIHALRQGRDNPKGLRAPPQTTSEGSGGRKGKREVAGKLNLELSKNVPKEHTSKN